MILFDYIFVNDKQESKIDFKEIEEALIIVKDRRNKANTKDDYVDKVDAEKIKSIVLE